jgi:hypothetical protein
VGTTVEWWQGHGSSGGSSVLPPEFAGRDDAETVAFIKKVRNTLIRAGSIPTLFMSPDASFRYTVTEAVVW